MGILTAYHNLDADLVTKELSRLLMNLMMMKLRKSVCEGSDESSNDDNCNNIIGRVDSSCYIAFGATTGLTIGVIDDIVAVN